MKKIFFYSLLIVIGISCRKDMDVSNNNSHADNNLGVGKSAHDLLSSGTFTKLAIEIQYAPGMKPQDQSVNNLIAFLNTYLNKPAGITVTQTQVASTDSTSIGTQTAANLESKNRTFYNNGQTIAVYIFFADAAFTSNVNVVGEAYKNTSVFLLEKTIQSKTGGFGQPSRVLTESSVLEHEMGHLVGLVNVTTPMVAAHEDAAHKGHCTKVSCLMYYNAESNAISGMGSIPVFDDNCKNDLKANGGK